MSLNRVPKRRAYFTTFQTNFVFQQAKYGCVIVDVETTDEGIDEERRGGAEIL